MDHFPVTGTSVLGIKYKDGIMLAADTLASYGSLAQTRDMERLASVSEFYADDGHSLGPEHIHEFLARVLYERRSKNDPLWNSLVVGGFKHGKSFLGYVDYQGTTYHASTIATGYGAYIAQPLLRNAVEGREETLTEAEAIKVLDDSLRVLFYRDARSLNSVQRATITASGTTITAPYSLETEWGFADSIRGYGAIYE
ncbi:Proteasome subunit beta type-7 [Kappamyces sp. JEL0680]|nr:Proteasome subunit beta type-7 [Kappamyces sp. JEL0680]